MTGAGGNIGRTPHRLARVGDRGAFVCDDP